MIIYKQFFFALRLAWRQMIHERAKLVAATLGVLFSCVLLFMQLGFRDSLFASTTILPRAMKGDLYILHKQTEAMYQTISFSRTQVFRTLGNDAVLDATPLYVNFAKWKNPENNIKRSLLLFGYDPDKELFSNPAIVASKDLLKKENTVIFDELSTPDFGPIKQMLGIDRVYSEVNDRKIEIVGTFKLGANFASDGNVFTSEQNFQRIFPNRNIDQVDYGVITLKKGSDINTVKQQLISILDEDLLVLTQAELADFEKQYWGEKTPIGFIFGFGMVMGLVVGMVIVYQILFTDITNNLQEYATLKAIGYSNNYLSLVVFASSLILALLGFLPGLLIASLLYNLTESIIYILMPLPISKILIVFSIILGMCILAGLIAMKKLKAANPAEML
ncbi:MAG: ABC transporter permease DevC [Alphaproteobacteria bacterium]|jgi:putative ABC transport system permease protein